MKISKAICRLFGVQNPTDQDLMNVAVRFKLNRLGRRMKLTLFMLLPLVSQMLIKDGQFQIKDDE
jgi:hypothetical protein